jgi:hypothetical protein
LSQDNINYIFSIKVQLGHEYIELGVFSGVVNKVHVYFIHNELLFPSAYPDGTILLI